MVASAKVAAVAWVMPSSDLEAATLRSFRDLVGRVVRAVPAGRVATYGDVAGWAGRPGAARQVGAALRSLAAEDPAFPWQRIINARGGISTYKVGAGELQEALLKRDGVEVVNGTVDLARYRFVPQEPI
jgi:methylated-DNA-protein-cysteine methyltransferase-like protein